MKIEVQVTAEELLACKYQINLTNEFPVSFSTLTGNGYSGLKGSGSDFYGIREYQQGDTCKRVNRQATARTDVLHLNEYLEERLLSAYILIDQSTHLFFTSTHIMKSVVGARKGAEILFHYLKNGHRVSGEVFDEYTHSGLPLTTSEVTSDEWIEIVAEYNRALPGKNYSGKKNALLNVLIQSLGSEISGREIYIVSDFMIYETPKLIEPLIALCGKNRIYLIQLTDKLEENPPLKQWLSDGKSEFVLRSEDERTRYKQFREDKKQQLVRFSRENNIAFTEIFT